MATTTITATKAKDTTYNSATASYTLTIDRHRLQQRFCYHLGSRGG